MSSICVRAKWALFPFRLVLEANCSCRTDRHRAEEIWTANPSATGHRVLGQNTASLLSFLTSGTAKYDASGIEAILQTQCDGMLNEQPAAWPKTFVTTVKMAQ